MSAAASRTAEASGGDICKTMKPRVCGFRGFGGAVACGMDSHRDQQAALALLHWQMELGATEAICDAPVNRFDLSKSKPVVKAAPAEAVPASEISVAAPDPVAPVALARETAALASDLEGLAAALAAFEQCELKRGARNTVFADGNPAARVMVIGEAPGRDEDIAGKPFVGRAGQLLDRMFAAIGMSRAAPDPDAAVYITNVLPWRPPQNREPTPEEIAMMLPFVERHVRLAEPELLVLVGNVSCQALLGRKGITRMRGQWTTALDLPALPMFHPAYLLRQPHHKREAWNDLLMLQAKLREPS